MWFKFPKGAEAINIERQHFVAEFHDASGGAYFRAPNHFAVKILQIHGFSAPPEMPEGAPEDLAPVNASADSAISTLTATLAATEAKHHDLRGDYDALVRENAQLRDSVQALNAQMSDLDDEVDDLKAKLMATTPAPVAEVETVGKKVVK